MNNPRAFFINDTGQRHIHLSERSMRNPRQMVQSSKNTLISCRKINNALINKPFKTIEIKFFSKKKCKILVYLKNIIIFAPTIANNKIVNTYYG